MSKPIGRPSTYDDARAAEICERIAKGESLTSICKDPGMPNRETVTRWAWNDINGFQARYTEARELACDLMADEILEIADDGRNDWMARNDPDNPGYAVNGEYYQRTRTRIDTRKWYLSKIAPKRFGDKVVQEHTGPGGGPIQTQALGETEVARRIAFVLAAGLAQVSPQPGSSLLAQPDAAQGPSEDDDIV